MKDKSRLEAIFLTDFEEKYGPPQSNVLQIGMSGGIVFLSIGKYDELDHSTTQMVATSQFGIDYETLVKALAFAKDLEVNAGA